MRPSPTRLIVVGLLMPVAITCSVKPAGSVEGVRRSSSNSDCSARCRFISRVQWQGEKTATPIRTWGPNRGRIPLRIVTPARRTGLCYCAARLAAPTSLEAARWVSCLTGRSAPLAQSAKAAQLTWAPAAARPVWASPTAARLFADRHRL